MIESFEMSRSLVAACLVCLAAGCASVEQVQRAGGATEHVIGCGFLNWMHCYERAREICPEGYKVLSETEGYRPRELRITCQASQK